ncbi:hypothetical protein EG68_00143 [Paragonimus skrjabini miyazakii]|uniref:Uncharacterized protein n=1 Tax=Paragonimus skrjabini miyazakii TaxID=59628 RepID=A0A8S9Z5B9_9TREM|nr:hypothetical protein EG68_00143 [Paragonimus skrjabini miyazakii]
MMVGSGCDPLQAVPMNENEDMKLPAAMSSHRSRSNSESGFTDCFVLSALNNRSLFHPVELHFPHSSLNALSPELVHDLCSPTPHLPETSKCWFGCFRRLRTTSIQFPSVHLQVLKSFRRGSAVHSSLCSLSLSVLYI